MPLIDEQLRAGVRLKTIMDSLRSEGFDVSIHVLRKARFKWLKAQKTQPINPTHIVAAKPAHAIESSPTTAISPSPSVPVLTSKGDLAQLRRGTEIDLNELARLGKQHRKE